MAEPKPFGIVVSDELVSFINQRVSTARIPPGLDLPEQDAWSFGIPTALISELRDYWEKKYDWRTVEARINSHLKIFTLPITKAGETMAIHFVHHRSEREGAIPLLIQYGWPGNFLEVEPTTESLTSPKDLRQQAFHVVAPSLPGFAFSEGPKGVDFLMRNIAAVNHKLMVALVCDEHVAQSSDLGTMVVEYMGMDYPKSCVAVHVNGVMSGAPNWLRYPFHLVYLIIWAIQNRNNKDAQFGRVRWWLGEESGYSEIQGTKPQTISYGLVDSPIGMLAWTREKVQFLVDDYEWKAGDIITLTMMYFIPGMSGHANTYKNLIGERFNPFYKTLYKRLIPSNVDFGISIYTKGVMQIPRWWASCSASHNILFWREHDKGGHFLPMGQPDVFVEDVTDFSKVINPTRKAVLINEPTELSLCFQASLKRVAPTIKNNASYTTPPRFRPSTRL